MFDFWNKLVNGAIALLAITCFVACQNDVSSVQDDEIEAETKHLSTSAPISFGTSYQIKSDVYAMNREINVYAPTLPEWGQDYFEIPLPVLYVIDGGLEQDFFHIAALSQLTLINGERQPMIVVGVRTHDRRPEISPKADDPRYLTNGFEGWGGSHTFRKHLLEEVKPFIEARYDVGRSSVIGESLAGLFIAEIFMEEPASFDDYISISPSLWWDDRNLAKNSASLLSHHQASDRRFYLTMADEGGTMRLGLEEMLNALAQYQDVVTTKFVDRANSDTHSSIYHHAARDALSWMYGMPIRPYGDAPWYLTEGGQPPEGQEK